MNYRLRSIVSQWSRQLAFPRMTVALLFSAIFLMLVSISGCSTVGSVTLPAKPYLLPMKPLLIPCQEPISLPSWMESMDLSSKTSLSEWERQTLRTIAQNGEIWKKCRERNLVLIEWISSLPEST